MPDAKLKCEDFKSTETTPFKVPLEKVPLEKVPLEKPIAEKTTTEETSEEETSEEETSEEETESEESSDEETGQEKPPAEKTSFKKTSELTRRLQLLEKIQTLKRRLRAPRRPKPRKKRAIIPSVTDAIKEEEYIEPDPATLERLIMKTTNAKTVEDNKCTDEQRERSRRARRKNLERAGLMLDPGDENKVYVYVDFDTEECRALDDEQEVLRAAYASLVHRELESKFANPTGQPPQGMMRVGLVVETESERPEDVFADAIKALESLQFTHKLQDMEHPIGYENVTLSLIHYGFPANGAVPSSVGVGVRLYEL